MSEKDIFTRWTEITGRIMAQITSGRWIITIAAVYCLGLLTKTLCTLMTEGKITLEASTYVAIIMSILQTVGTIVIFYFQKNRPADSGDNGNSDNSDTTTTTTLPPK